MFKIFLSILVFTISSTNFNAQSSSKKATHQNQFSVVFGLTQPLLLDGFNIEGALWTNKFVFDYSHGFNLQVKGKLAGEEIENQKLNFKITHSLGFGIGYRFTKAFNVRFEPKMHIYETYYENQSQNRANSLVNFTTYTLGFGAYYRWLPFEDKNNILKGLTIIPSIRYWYKVNSSLQNDKFDYFNRETNRNETFNAPNIGVNNSPFIVNLSVGYNF